MRIGVPAEIKANEHRVGLVPSSVKELTAKGHNVYVETGAGHGIAAPDVDYIEAGAEILETAEAVFQQAQMIVKVKEPQPTECARLTSDQILFTYLHLAADAAQAAGLIASGCSAIAYETITDDQGGLPLLAPMSEVAGRLSVIEGASCLKAHEGGRGLLVSGVPGTKAADIVIIGGGVVGANAARLAVGLGAHVTIFDRSLRRLRYLSDIFGVALETRYSTDVALAEALLSADMVIGAVLIPGASAPQLVSRAQLKQMKRGAVLVDVAIDQGGCFETSRPTTHQDPTYVVDGIVHYCVANMPGAVPLTSSEALNNATLPFVLALAENGMAALETDSHLAAGLNVHQGKLVHQAVIKALHHLTAAE